MAYLRKDLIASAVAVVLFTVMFGLVYPLFVTGAAQVLFPNKADGSRIERDGKVVGSRLIAQDFRGDRRYFQPRPSQTEYAANATGFLNQGPNQQELADLTKQRIARLPLAGAAVHPGTDDAATYRSTPSPTRPPASIPTSPRPTPASRRTASRACGALRWSGSSR